MTPWARSCRKTPDYELWPSRRGDIRWCRSEGGRRLLRRAACQRPVVDDGAAIPVECAHVSQTPRRHVLRDAGSGWLRAQSVTASPGICTTPAPGTRPRTAAPRQLPTRKAGPAGSDIAPHPAGLRLNGPTSPAIVAPPTPDGKMGPMRRLLRFDRLMLGGEPDHPLHPSASHRPIEDL